MEKNLIASTNEYLSSSLAQALELIAVIEDSEDKDITIDLAGITCLTPALALSLLVYCSKNSKNIQFSNIGDKLRSVFFDCGGLKSDDYRSSAFKAMLEGYADKLYCPIICFPANAESDYKDLVSTAVEDLIIRQLNILPNVATGMKYIIEETLDNVSEHSHSDQGYIYAMANPDKHYLDISIADRGITLLGSYKSLPDNEIADDLEAIKAANRGISSKNLPDAENRGYGIYTSKRMIIEGLEGQYMMISGAAFYLKDNEYDNFFSLPKGYRWEGTIISFRLHYEIPDFNYIKYIE